MWWGWQGYDADKDADKDNNMMTRKLRHNEDEMTWRRQQGQEDQDKMTTREMSHMMYEEEML